MLYTQTLFNQKLVRALTFSTILLLSAYNSAIVNAEESLSVSFKVRSMYYDPNDADIFQSKYEGTAVNGVPDKDRYLYVKRNEKKDYAFYYGYLDDKDQPNGAVSAVVWLEDAKTGKFIKTLGRWCGNFGYNGSRPGYSIKMDDHLSVQGDAGGRIYDLMRFNGLYGQKIGSNMKTIPRCPYVRKIGFTSGQTSNNPFDGSPGDYDSILGPTVGCKVQGEIYLHVDNPRTVEDDASVLSTTAIIPKRSDSNQPQAWNLSLDWNPETGKTEQTHLPEGEYNIIIEAVEWAMEGEYHSELSAKAPNLPNPILNTRESQMYFQQFDHFKVIRYKYDGKSWKMHKKSNLDDVYATDTMARALKKKKVKGYLNYWTGNKLIRGKNEPAVIYDIAVDYTNE